MMTNNKLEWLKKITNNKILQAGSLYLLSDFFVKGLSFITIPIFTRVLTTSEYGIVSYFSSYVSVLSVVMGLGLASSIAKAKYDYKENYESYISNISFLTVISFCLFYLISIVFQNPIINAIKLTNLMIILIIIESFFNSIRKIFTVKLRFDYKFKLLAIINVVSAIIIVMFSLILIFTVFSNQKYFGRIISQVAIHGVLAISMLVYLLKKGGSLINVQQWKYSLTFSLPFIFHDLASVINIQFDRIIINRYLGSSFTGIYSFAYTIGMIILVLWNSSNQAYAPWFFEKMENREYDKIRLRASTYRDLFTLLYGVILFISPELVKVMSDESYWIGLDIVPWIFLSYYVFFLVSFEIKIEYFFKKNKYITFATVLSALVNIVLNIALIPKYGYSMAAITTVISYILMFVFHYSVTRYILKINIYKLGFYLYSLVMVTGITTYFILFKDQTVIRILGIFLLLPLSIRIIKSLK